MLNPVDAREVKKSLSFVDVVKRSGHGSSNSGRGLHEGASGLVGVEERRANVGMNIKESILEIGWSINKEENVLEVVGSCKFKKT